MEENKANTEERELTQEEIIAEAIQQAYEETIFPLELNEEEINKAINSVEFIDGQSIGNKIGGIYTQLINLGMCSKDIIDIILNYMNTEHNLEVQRLNVEISKNQVMQQEKNSL